MKGEKEGKGREESEKGEGRKGQMKKCKRSRICTHSVPEKKSTSHEGVYEGVYIESPTEVPPCHCWPEPVV